MISQMAAKIVDCLPKSLAESIAKKIVFGYIKKYANIKVNGIENIKDASKPILFVCNHLSNSDGVVLDEVLREMDVTFVAGIKLSKNPLTDLGLRVVKTIPIKPDSADIRAITTTVKKLKSGCNILIFPEGTRSRKAKMLEGKKGTVLIAQLSKANIVPIGIHGSENLMPIDDSNMGNEKFYHADVYVNIGKSFCIPKREADEKKHAYEDRCMKYVMLKIAELVPKEYRGVYE